MIPFELDHFFVFVPEGFPEQGKLAASGFNAGLQKRHEGQGTANRAVCLEQTFLEFIWVESEADAAANPLKLQRRSRHAETGASPFGIGLRGKLKKEQEQDYWLYQPPYAPDKKIWIHKFDNEKPHFPLIFVMDSSGRGSLESFWPVNFLKERFEYLLHPNGSTRINEIVVSGPGYAELNGILTAKSVRFRDSERFFARISLDGEFIDTELGDLALLRTL